MKLLVLLCLLVLPAALHAQAAAAPVQAPPEIAPSPAAVPAGTPVNRPKPIAVAQPKWAASEAAPADDVDALSAEAVKKAITALQSHYLSGISEEQMNRATLQGLLDSLSPLVSLSGSGEKTAPAAPFYSETFENRVGYLRLGTLSDQNLRDAGLALGAWRTKKIGAVILDLRSTPACSDFGLAWQLGRLFCAKVDLMLTGNGNHAVYLASDLPRPFEGLLVVLVDGGTTQAAEAAAAVLQQTAKAILVGDPTAGRACEFTDLPLEKGVVLHAATARAVVNGHAITGALKPDIAEDRGHFARADIMREISAHGVARVVTERGRSHLNEAALVAGRDPEIDTLEAEQQASRQQAPARIIDRQLQRALDLVTSISVFQARKAPAATDPIDSEN